MKYIHFYALRDDIERIIRDVEYRLDLACVQTGNFATPTVRRYGSGLESEDLGIAASPSSIANPTFLVGLREQGVKVRETTRASGEPRFLVDQLANPDTVS